MTFIDWSDAEGMFGLLLEFVADERADCAGDPERQRFLSDLGAQLRVLEPRIASVSTSALVQALKDTSESVDPAFAADPVLTHLHDCIDALERTQT